MKRKISCPLILILILVMAFCLAVAGCSNGKPSVTKQPTSVPTDAPTELPTPTVSDEGPTKAPTSEPTEKPTSTPGGVTTAEPTETPVVPTKAPTPTEAPTPTPTEVPTPTPTNAPTPTSTRVPTPTPTPTNAPTPISTKVPTPTPTKAPTPIPTKAPTPTPTKAPTPTPDETVMYKLNLKDTVVKINYESGTKTSGYQNTLAGMGLESAGISYIAQGATSARVVGGTYALVGDKSLLATALDQRVWSISMPTKTSNRIFMEFYTKFINETGNSVLTVSVSDPNISASANEGQGGAVIRLSKSGNTVNILNCDGNVISSFGSGEKHKIAFSFAVNSNKYDVYVDDVRVSANNTWIGSLKTINAFRFDVNSGSTKTIIDEIILTYGTQVTKEEFYATPTPTPTLPPLPTQMPQNVIDSYVNNFNNDTTMTIGNANATGLNAFGVEWDPHFWRTCNTTSRSGNKKVNEEDWQMILRRAKELGIQKVRVWIMPSWYEPTNDNNDPNVTDLSKFNFSSDIAVNRNYYSVIRQLDFCEENDIDVNITVWGADSWLFFTHSGSWVSAPNDADEYAENVAALFGDLLNTRKYTCVKELTISNEPDSSFLMDDGHVSHDYYVEVCTKVSQKLAAVGLRNKIKMVLSDDINGNQTWLRNTVNRLNDVADGYDSHTYVFGNESSYSSMYNWAKTLNDIVDAKAPAKQYTHNEFGGNKNVGAYRQMDINEYYRGVYYARMMCAFMNAGSNGMLHWCFYDEYYNDGADDGDINVNGNSRMMIGLFAYKDQDWAIRPFYHSWGLIMKYTRKGSSVYPISTNKNLVQGTAFKSPEGKWSYVLVNSDTGSSHRVKLTEKEANISNLYVHVYTESSEYLEDERLIPASSMAYVKNGVVYIEIPANSFVMVTELG